MIPPINGKLVRTLPFKSTAGEELLFELTPDDDGTITFRTTGRKPLRMKVLLRDVLASLEAPEPDAEEAPPAPGGVAKKLLRGSKCCDTISLIDLEHELSIAHPDDTPDVAKFLKFVYAVMRARAARKEET